MALDRPAPTRPTQGTLTHRCHRPHPHRDRNSVQELIEAEAAALIGAALFERTSDRRTHRNGTRPRTLTTASGNLDLKIPKLRAGSFFPALPEWRRRVDQALFAVVLEAYVHGI